MTYIFLDESGDLGFKKTSSKWFLFTLVAIDEPRKLDKIIKKARKSLKKKHKHRFSELHAYHCDDITRIRILKSLAEIDILINKNIIDEKSVTSLIVDKKDTNKNLKNNFIDYITKAMNQKQKATFKMSLTASHDSKGIQAVDFISWAIFRKYEQGDYEFYEIIKDKIIDERLLFP